MISVYLAHKSPSTTNMRVISLRQRKEVNASLFTLDIDLTRELENDLIAMPMAHAQ